jgi:hydrogenase-4 component E
MALFAYHQHPSPDSASEWIALVDLALVRGVVAPFVLYRVLRARGAPRRNDVIPPNLLFWTMALGIVLVAFRFAERMIPASGEQQTLLAVTASGFLLGFLVLSTQVGPFSQMVGVLRIENAIALFELGGAEHRAPMAIQLGQIGVALATVFLYGWYLARLDPESASSAASAPEPESIVEGPTL